MAFAKAEPFRKRPREDPTSVVRIFIASGESCCVFALHGSASHSAVLDCVAMYVSRGIVRKPTLSADHTIPLLYLSLYTYIHIYIYIERERETHINYVCVCIYIYIYTYTYVYMYRCAYVCNYNTHDILICDSAGHGGRNPLRLLHAAAADHVPLRVRHRLQVHIFILL